MELDGGSCEKNMSAKMSRNTLEKSIFISGENTEKTKENKNFSFYILIAVSLCSISNIFKTLELFKYFLKAIKS